MNENLDKWPECQNVYLKEVLLRLKQRTKSLKMVGHIWCSAGIDRHSLSVVEGLEVNFEPLSFRFPVWIQIVIYDNGASRVVVRESRKKSSGRNLIAVRREHSLIPVDTVVRDVERTFRDLVGLQPPADSPKNAVLFHEIIRRWS